MLTRCRPVDVPRVPRSAATRLPGRPASALKTASGGLRLAPPRRAWRTASQAADASGENWSSRPWSRRGAVLPQKTSLLDDLKSLAKSAICSLPTINAGGGADGYAGVGGSISGSYSLDFANGRFGLSGYAGVGVGFGIDAGPNIGGGPSGGGVASANIAVSGGFALPVAPGVNVGSSGTYNLIGTNPGFSGAAIGRAGTPLGYGNIGANVGLSTPKLYDLGC
jgi:hypothetical protein